MPADERCTVRAARSTDVERMVGLLALLFALEADFRPDPVLQRQGLALLLEDERARVLVAQKADEVVGMCTGQLVVSTAEGGPALLVEEIGAGRIAGIPVLVLIAIAVSIVAGIVLVLDVFAGAHINSTGVVWGTRN